MRHLNGMHAIRTSTCTPPNSNQLDACFVGNVVVIDERTQKGIGEPQLWTRIYECQHPALVQKNTAISALPKD